MVIQRLIKESGVAAVIACLFTPIAYLLATRHDGRFHDAFQNHWETVGAAFVLVALGLLEMGRGAGSLAAGVAIIALGIAVLYKVVFG
jgi:uncharacterized MAPEG superfamily protein